MCKMRVPGVVFAILLVACAPATSEQPAPTSTTTSTTAITGTDDAATTPVVDEAQSDATESETGVAFDEAGLSLGPGRAFTVLDDPPMVPASSALWLKDDDVMLGIVNGGEAHAFPAAQLAYHHIVNTTIAGEPYLVTY